MRPLLFLAALLALPACPTTEGEDLPGQLCQVSVETVMDSCAPPRAVGDGGVQWLGERADGGLVFTIFDSVEFGPLRDGGVMLGISRVQAPTAGGGRINFGDGGVDCDGTFVVSPDADGGIGLSQVWPGLDRCPGGPAYLPDAGCVSLRRMIFTPIRDCPQRCVTLSNDGAACDC